MTRLELAIENRDDSKHEFGINVERGVGDRKQIELFEALNRIYGTTRLELYRKMGMVLHRGFGVVTAM